MTIQRGSISIPNPKGTREVLPGDTLLCFGKTLTLKGLAPRKKRGKRKSKSGPAAPMARAGDEPLSEGPPSPIRRPELRKRAPRELAVEDSGDLRWLRCRISECRW